MDQKSIEEIYKRFGTPENVIKHMQKVAYVCEKIANAMLSKGIKVDKEAMVNAALLHDTLRMIDFKDQSAWQKLKNEFAGLHHEAAMAKFLEGMGEKKLANLVEKHGFFEIDNLKTWEEKILYYADKRVDHDQVVSLKKRFIEGKKRNASMNDDEEKVKTTEEKVFKLEKEFIEILGKELLGKGSL